MEEFIPYAINISTAVFMAVFATLMGYLIKRRIDRWDEEKLQDREDIDIVKKTQEFMIIALATTSPQFAAMWDKIQSSIGNPHGRSIDVLMRKHNLK